jgi:6-phosphofructokinase 1
LYQVNTLKTDEFQYGFNVKSIVCLTAGGDAPGMNAAIRAVTRAAIVNACAFLHLHRLQGAYSNEIEEFKTNIVATSSEGWNDTETARCEEFMTEREKDGLRKHATS